MDRGSSKARAWSASAWQREQANNLREWRSSSQSLTFPFLTTLCEAVGPATLGRASSPQALCATFPRFQTQCNDVGFENGDEVAAYTILYLVERYRRMTHVLEQLFTAGHLPIRRLKLAALEVGAGPAPGLSAIRDFYDDLTVWAQRTNQPVDFAPLTHAFAMDKGPAWEALLHDLWERINELRLQSLGYMGSGLYQVQYSDFTDFSAIQEHTRALESSVRIIEDDFDRAGECISRASARQWAQEEGVHVPSAYDLIVMSNFLTDPQAAKRFSKEIRRLASSLTPGGLIVVLGGQARFYEGLWADLGRLLGGAGLTPLKAFDNPIPSRHDSRWAEQIQAQRHRDLEAIRRDGGTLPRSLENTDEPYRIREFSALVWKNQQPAK